MADKSFQVEVLQTGTFKGVSITADDLDQLVENFAVVGDAIRPPVKLGHSGAQILGGQRNGDPALGWVTALRRVKDKLVATVSNVPKQLADLIDKKRYRRVSSELSLDFANSPWELNLKSGVTGKVLTGLALLGADLPAVATLEDLGALLASEDGGDVTIELTPCDDSADDDNDAGATGTDPAAVWLTSDVPRTVEPAMQDADTDPVIDDADDLTAADTPSGDDALELGALGDFLRARMKEKDLQVADLAKSARVSPATMQSILGGEIERPPDVRLRALARLLGTSFDKLRSLLPKDRREPEAQAQGNFSEENEMQEQVVALQAEIDTLKTEIAESRAREAVAQAKTRQSEAAAFVDKYSRADCLKLTTDEQRAAVRALYVALDSGEKTLRLSADGDEQPVIDGLTAFLNALPDQKAMLEPVADPKAGNTDADAEPYDQMLRDVAEKHDLNLDVQEDLAKAANLVAQSDAVKDDPTVVGVRGR